MIFSNISPGTLFPDKIIRETISTIPLLKREKESSTMRHIAQDRTTRIIHKFSDKQKERYPKDRPLKDKVYYCRTRQQVLELFDSLIINFGESLTLQTLVDVKDDGNFEWVDQEVKMANKNKPKVPYQGEHTLIKEPKNKSVGWY